mmetsp:Transcript_53849/g.89592  ORF Transcript_53849/g.89592 Transcript_53849/m.89592 type:complete len:347 (-) Transcript_53849:131-1171(-)|eukprot:CAMPEP_0184334330 /NCGR_PEP_ID=MMETSP1089-20130417/3159_1 /TAXON_ID=38269 ORGANISM="Gloeochaete wittrockiana, Strain SAG46.84" /NCGR_SAMPLE_ID=MMETSP1089 /ASSEMBLY_ACC=CAM_ASM_000445 /LENGTH=346 /DNA_ID=CAMNT_0026658563 /DNA_START=48 /DNA_END=1088 /DNA_ORIENTATION=-
MGTFFGHAATGFFFFSFGLWSFLKSLDLRCLSLMRTNDFFIAFPSSSLVWGGLAYFIGEVLSALSDGSFTMSHVQHLIMSSWFTLSGLVQILHMFRFLSGTGFAAFMPVMWVVLSILFYFHPQKTTSLQFGHSSVGLLLAAVALLQLIEISVSLFSNPQHHAHQQARLALRDRAKRNGNPMPAPQECPCQCGVTESRILPIFTNPFIYSTVVPLLIGYLMMIVGTLDWGMAVEFFTTKNSSTDPSMIGMDDAMDMGDSEMDPDWMSAEETFLMHMLFNMLLQVVIAISLKQVDRVFFSSCPTPDNLPRWRDELTPHCPTPHFDKYMASLDQNPASSFRKREINIES